MRLATEELTCPECGKPAIGTKEELTGMAVLDIDHDGNAEYGGETTIFWNEQKSARTPDGKLILICDDGHEWAATPIDETKEGAGESQEPQDENTNCLYGMKCPKCGSLGPFNISVTCQARVYDSGTEDLNGDTEWGNDSYCGCVSCGFDGAVCDFKSADDEEGEDVEVDAPASEPDTETTTAEPSAHEKMLISILERANAAYCDGWGNLHKLSMKDGERGDGLADFIVNEAVEVTEGIDDEETAKNEIRRAIANAIGELEAVLDAI